MKTIFEERYERLNKAQREAVDTIEGPVMVIAGPGTGKTTIITLRIANILLQTDTPASAILAITFTESGVRSLKDKLKEIIGERALEVRIHTFHSFASSIMAEFPDHFTHIHNFKQITEIEAESLIRKILESKEFTLLRPFGDPDYYLPQILRNISESKKEALSPESINKFALEEIEKIKKDENSISTRGATKGELKATALKDIERLEKTILFAKAYEQYEIAKKDEKLIDYDDLIFELLLALGRDELLKKLLQEKFLYLHIDEHQDTNDSQNLIIKILADFYESPNICIVGDEKQAIYRFQGASVDNFLTFTKLWKNIKIIKLENNYRSSQPILDASFAMIERNYLEDEHNDLRLRLLGANKERPRPIEIVTTPNLMGRDEYLVKEVKNILENSKDDMAIIARNNRELDQLLALLEGRGIAVTTLRSIDIFNHPVGRLFISLLRTVMDPNNIDSIGETIVFGLWGIPFEERLAMTRQLRQGKVEEVVAKIEPLNEIDKLKFSDGPINYIYKIAEISGLNGVIIREQVYVEVWRAILLLCEHLIKTYQIQDAYKLMSVLDEEARSISQRKINLKIGASNSRVKLMTAHGSKGLEFDNVFIPYGVDEAWSLRKKSTSFILPIQSKISDADHLRDARRLFYVALTRAKSRIVIMVPERNEEKEYTELRFIGELDEKQIIRIDAPDLANDSLFVPKSKIISKDKIINLTKEVIKEKGLSVTALNQFLACPTKFIIRSILKLPEAPSLTSEKGNAMHYAMAQVAGEKDRNVESIKSIIENSVRRYLAESLLFSFEKEALLAELLKFSSPISQSLYGHFNQSGNYLPEKWYECDYKGVKLNGRLDLVLDKGEKSEVYDYKTRSKMSEKEIREGDYGRQLCFYSLLVPNSTPSLIFLIPNKAGICEKVSLEISESDREKLKAEIDTLLEDVESGEFLKTSCRDLDCEYCSMRELLY